MTTIQNVSSDLDIDKILIYASAAAESIGDDSNFKFPQNTYPNFLQEIDLIDEPKIIVGDLIEGTKDVNACFIANTQDSVILAFRGTLPFNAKDVASVIDWVLVDASIHETVGKGIPGKVHFGFWKALDSLWNDIVTEIEKHRSNDKLKLYITGHSKGGSLATLATVRFHFERNYSPEQLYTRTFAAARVGNLDFANTYNSIFNHVRYEYADDIVPHLPPSNPLLTEVIETLTPTKIDHLPFYESAGKLRFIDWNKKLEDDSHELELLRVGNLFKKALSHGGWVQIFNDHNIGCGSGYVTSVAPDSDGTCCKPQSLEEVAHFVNSNSTNQHLVEAINKVTAEKQKEQSKT